MERSLRYRLAPLLLVTARAAHAACVREWANGQMEQFREKARELQTRQIGLLNVGGDVPSTAAYAAAMAAAKVLDEARTTAARMFEDAAVESMSNRINRELNPLMDFYKVMLPPGGTTGGLDSATRAKELLKYYHDPAEALKKWWREKMYEPEWPTVVAHLLTKYSDTLVKSRIDLIIVHATEAAGKHPADSKAYVDAAFRDLTAAAADVAGDPGATTLVNLRGVRSWLKDTMASLEKRASDAAATAGAERRASETSTIQTGIRNGVKNALHLQSQAALAALAACERRVALHPRSETLPLVESEVYSGTLQGRAFAKKVWDRFYSEKLYPCPVRCPFCHEGCKRVKHDDSEKHECAVHGMQAFGGTHFINTRAAELKTCARIKDDDVYLTMQEDGTRKSEPWKTVRDKETE